MKVHRLLLAALLSLGLGFGLVACGGDDDPPAAVVPPVVIPPVVPPVAKVAVAVTAAGNIVTFDVTTPGTFSTSVAITGLGAETILGLDVRPADGLIYGLTRTRIFTIDRATGAATLVSTLAADPADLTAPFTVLAGTTFGVDFNPVPDRLRVVSDSGENLRINVTTGLVTTDSGINGGSTIVNAAAYVNSFSGATTTTLYVLDSSSDQLFIQNPPNNGTLIGGLTVTVGGSTLDFGATNAFDIDGATGIAYAVLTAGGTNSLYTINLATGAATLVGTAGTGAFAIVGFSILP